VIEHRLSGDRQVFLGRASEKQGKADDAITAYKAASKIKPVEELAWKGLVNVYEGQGSRYVNEHSDASLKLAQIYMEKYVRLENSCQRY